MTPHVYVIATHWRLPGVYLSCKGGWGNLPYPDEAAARRAAAASAGRDAHRVETVSYGRRTRSDTSPDWLTT